jgi:hypothetical protein
MKIRLAHFVCILISLIENCGSIEVHPLLFLYSSELICFLVPTCACLCQHSFAAAYIELLG